LLRKLHFRTQELLLTGFVSLDEAIGDKTMIKMTIAVATTAMLIGLSNMAWAQQSSGSTSTNAARSGGPGTHVGAQRTGSASNNQKVLGEHNGYGR
jgi:hypothetical protein